MDNIHNINPALSINVAEETAKVQKEVVEKGRVRISKKVKEEQETVTVPIISEEVKVEKVPVNKFVEDVPQVRYESDTMIIPVIKEVLVVEKKLMLVEEVHVTKHKTEMQDQRTIALRKEEVTVERIPSTDNKI
jgi:uncharacterized protein (TIGR02271 family)